MTDDLQNIISKNSQSNFYYTFSLLPGKKREALNTIYTFCRSTDDIVDLDHNEHSKKIAMLSRWRKEFEKALLYQSEFPLLNTVAKIIHHFKIPTEPFFELMKGVEMDLFNKRYLTFQDLLEYCYRVASTVGLMAIEIFGYKNQITRDYAINLGIAMQLTNILRDIKEDSKVGRIYLPQEDLKKFHYSEQDILNEVFNDNFRSLMKYESDRAENYYQKATECLNSNDRKNLFTARAMQYIYHGILKKIRKKNYNVFQSRIKISSFEKLFFASGVWAKYHLVYR